MGEPLSRAALVRRIDRRLAKIIGEDLPILTQVKKFVVKSGGKRIRPVSHYFFARIFGYTGEDWTDVGAIGELIHAASLLHDDVVDESGMRRGKPSINALHGNKTAVLSGDYLLACGLDHLLTLERSAELLPIFTRVIRQLAASELLQMQLEREFSLDERIYERIIHGKTASLFGAMAEAAFVLASNAETPPGETKRAEYREFGERMGRVFQIRDDFLDYFGEASANGKDLYQDFKRGLVTRPVLFLRKAVGARERKSLEALWRADERRVSPDGLAEWRRLADRHGIRGKLAREIEEEIHALMSFVRQYPASPHRETVIEQFRSLLVPTEA